MSCEFCQYMVEGVCEMLTGEQDRNPVISTQLFLKFLNKECDALLGPTLQNLGLPCEELIGLIAEIGLGLINSLIWPQACHVSY